MNDLPSPEGSYTLASTIGLGASPSSSWTLDRHYRRSISTGSSLTQATIGSAYSITKPEYAVQAVPVYLRIMSSDGQTLYKTIEDDNSCQPYILLVIKLDVSRNLVTGLPDLSRRINLHMLYFLNRQTPPILPSFSRLGWAECDASSHSRSLPTITSTYNIHIETSWETLGTATAVTNHSLGSRNHVLSSVITPVEDEGYISDSSTRWLEDVD